jgi:O-antigen/teichoic acid export membrane protein
MITDNLKRFIKDTSWALASLAIAAVVQFILRVFLARYFGPADLGLYTLAFTVYLFGLIASCFGTDFGVTKYVAEAEGNSKRINLLVTSGISISFVSGCIMGLILYLASPYIAINFFRMPELTALLRIVSFAYPFIGLEKATLGFLNGVRRMRFFAFINIFQNILVIVMTIIFALTGQDIKYAVVALIIPVALISFIGLFFIRESLFRTNMAEYSMAIKMLLLFGFFIVLGNGMKAIQTYADSMLLGHFMKDVDVGLYAVAGILIQVVCLPPQAIQTITGPMIALYWGKSEIDKIEYLVNGCIKYTAFFAILCAFALGFLSQDLIKLFFGKDFVDAAFPLKILLVGTVFSAISTSVGSALASTAYVKKNLMLTGIIVLLGIILNILLIPPFGITGAAVATSTTMTISALAKLCFIQRLIRIRIDWIWIVKLFGFSVIISALAYGIGKIFNLYACTLLALIILITIMLRYFMISEDRKQIRKILSFQFRD